MLLLLKGRYAVSGEPAALIILMIGAKRLTNGSELRAYINAVQRSLRDRQSVRRF